MKISKIEDKEKYDHIKEGLKKHQIDGLVISGGDDTGSVIIDLHNNGIPCVHAPKTMDLDLMPYSVGGDSTINRIREFVRDLWTTGRTHNRILVVEVFGRYAGHTALRPAWSGGGASRSPLPTTPAAAISSAGSHPRSPANLNPEPPSVPSRAASLSCVPPGWGSPRR